MSIVEKLDALLKAVENIEIILKKCVATESKRTSPASQHAAEFATVTPEDNTKGSLRVALVNTKNRASSIAVNSTLVFRSHSFANSFFEPAGALNAARNITRRRGALKRDSEWGVQAPITSQVVEHPSAPTASGSAFQHESFSIEPSASIPRLPDSPPSNSFTSADLEDLHEIAAKLEKLACRTSTSHDASLVTRGDYDSALYRIIELENQVLSMGAIVTAQPNYPASRVAQDVVLLSSKGKGKSDVQ